MKKCCMCKLELDELKFKKNKTRKDGFQSQCIECHQEYRKQHYLQNRRKYINKAIVQKNIFRAWWREYKTQFLCANCGENHPACVQFHHPNDNKEDCVSQLVANCCKDKVLKEIDKCVPLCANCHFKKHWAEKGFNFIDL